MYFFKLPEVSYDFRPLGFSRFISAKNTVHFCLVHEICVGSVISCITQPLDNIFRTE
jgi:hypothetical protein